MNIFIVWGILAFDTVITIIIIVVVSLCIMFNFITNNVIIVLLLLFFEVTLDKSVCQILKSNLNIAMLTAPVVVPLAEAGQVTGWEQHQLSAAFPWPRAQSSLR